MSEKRKYGVPDLESMLYGSVTHSRSRRQRNIRIALRGLGKGVGQGYRYQWATKGEMKRLAPAVRAAVKELEKR